MNAMQALSARARITLALDDARREANEGIVAACEAALRKLDDELGARCALHIEMSQPRDV